MQPCDVITAYCVVYLRVVTTTDGRTPQTTFSLMDVYLSTKLVNEFRGEKMLAPGPALSREIGGDAVILIER